METSGRAHATPKLDLNEKCRRKLITDWSIDCVIADADGATYCLISFNTNNDWKQAKPPFSGPKLPCLTPERKSKEKIDSIMLVRD